MVKTIYIDVLFIVNLIINYLILFTCAKIAAIHFQKIRLLAASILGAIWSVFIFLPHFPFLTSLIFKLFMSALLCLCAFGKSSLLKHTLLFLGVTLAFGGVVFAASLLGFKNVIETRDGVYYIYVSLPTLLLSTLFSYILLSLIFTRSASYSEKQISNVSITNGETTIELRTLHDTGNSLCDPATNAPIIITDYSSIRSLFPIPVQNILDKTSPAFFTLALDSLCKFGTFKLIPFKTVGVSFSMMLAYRPEKVTLNNKKIPDALLAISETAVSDGGSYKAII